MRVRLAIAIALAAISIAIPALAADAPQPSSARTQKRVTAAHYPTLEKMLRRFSRQAGEGRTKA